MALLLGCGHLTVKKAPACDMHINHKTNVAVVSAQKRFAYSHKTYHTMLAHYKLSCSAAKRDDDA